MPHMTNTPLLTEGRITPISFASDSRPQRRHRARKTAEKNLREKYAFSTERNKIEWPISLPKSARNRIIQNSAKRILTGQAKAAAA